VLLLDAPRHIAAPQDGARKEFIGKYCRSCHNLQVKAGALAFESLDTSDVPPGAATWEKVIRKVRSGAMPPDGAPKPDGRSRALFAGEVETILDQAAETRPNPGRPALHRLNRAEYGNAIRDLLALEIDTISLLPPDDSSYGFDNVADVLGMSPVLLERYLNAAATIGALAVGAAAPPVTDHLYRIRLEVTQTHHIEGLPLGTRGGILIRTTVPVGGEYIVVPRLWRTNVGFIRGVSQPHEIEVSVDGKRAHIATVGTPEDYRMSLMEPDRARQEFERRLTARVPLRAGLRQIAVTFVEKSHAFHPALLRPFEAVFEPVDSDGIPQLESVVLRGPYNPRPASDSPSRRAIFQCREQTRNCAVRIVSSLARRAYRRPVQPGEIERLMRFFDMGHKSDGFDRGVEVAIERILADPAFLFRFEEDGGGLAGDRPHSVAELELASRLSFFLWSSIPDEALLADAEAGRLTRPEVLRKQAGRMLADAKADALVKNFAGQWLYLRNLEQAMPSRDEFPDFDDNLRQAMRRETEMLVERVIREDRSVLDLLTLDETSVNERLARHYGIPHVYGSHFRLVKTPTDARRGLLGQASILTVTSQPNRTSPVLRGKWILENLLGAPPPPPPPLTPSLKETKRDGRPSTVRQQLEEHRNAGACRSCHKLMDPLGFALENFNAVGAWRESDAGWPVDTSGELMDGTKLDGPVALRQALVANPEPFVRTLTEKLMTYALGRGLEYYDMPAVRAIVRQAGKSGYRWSALVQGVTESVPFRMRGSATAGRSVNP